MQPLEQSFSKATLKGCPALLRRDTAIQGPSALVASCPPQVHLLICLIQILPHNPVVSRETWLTREESENECQEPINVALSFLLGLRFLAVYSCDSALLLGNQAIRPSRHPTQADEVGRLEALLQPRVFFLLDRLQRPLDAGPGLTMEGLGSRAPEKRCEVDQMDQNTLV